MSKITSGTYKEEILKLHSEGKTNKEIATKLGLTRPQVAKWLSQNDIIANYPKDQPWITPESIKKNNEIKKLKRDRHTELKEKLDFVIDTQNEIMRIIRIMYTSMCEKKAIKRMIQ